MNVFEIKEVALDYDKYYKTPVGQTIDQIEKATISELLTSVKSCRALELGCGTGHWSEFLASKGFVITATDISDAMLSVANKKTIDNVCFRKLDATKLTFDDASYEAIFSFTMLEFTNNPKQVIDEAYRVLKPNSILILGCLNLNSQLGLNKHNDDTFRNAHFFTRKELELLLSNFSEVVIKECVFLDESFNILDNQAGTKSIEGAFFAIKARK